ncbi:MAG: peptide chain release factor 3 [Acidimicrobiales bacterium]
MGQPAAEAASRRTFAIISHPDAGKTTLTEKFLLYAGALQAAGTVKARAGRRSATSDWMEMEQKRGISISSTVLQFAYRDCTINLLDTPGHRDFSEDTYRVLAAVDAAVMVLDVAKGIEPQTRKLFEVCRDRGIPLLTFINKLDRPGREPLEILDEISEQLGLIPTPVTWPVGIPGDFRGVVDRRDGSFMRFTKSARGATEAAEEHLDADEAAAREGAAWDAAQEEVGLLSATGADLDVESFLGGITTPVFVGSALTNFGVRLLLDAVVDLAPAPSPKEDAEGKPRDLDSPVAGFVFKIQANMDPAHRDRIAFVRICSGHFQRGMTVTHQATGRPFATKYASTVFGSDRETIEEAFPGDVIGLVNASGLGIGDTLYEADPVRFPRIPSFAPEQFVVARPADGGRFKQFRRGLAQLDEEGVVQVLRHADRGDTAPILAAVGPMQFEVFAHRLEHEFGAPVELLPTSYKVARRTDAVSAPELRRSTGVEVLERADGTMLALFESPAWLARVEQDKPELTLERIIAD